jgi:hypothetical protein
MGKGAKQMPRKNTNTDLVPVFIPSLVSVLMHLELNKGRPLTEQEVMAIRDQSNTVLLHRSEALRLAERRGYDDLDPRRCWETWQQARKKTKPQQWA